MDLSKMLLERCFPKHWTTNHHDSITCLAAGEGKIFTNTPGVSQTSAAIVKPPQTSGGYDFNRQKKFATGSAVRNAVLNGFALPETNSKFAPENKPKPKC